MRDLTLGYSPCPNDTFIFHALVNGLVPTEGFRVRERLEDVETLNRLAMAGTLDLTKVSYHAVAHLRQEYALLRSGGALGCGCGPLIVVREMIAPEELKGKKIAIPGKLTTANLLLQLSGEGFENIKILPFEQIMPAVASGAVEAGVIIHESRFTYREHGLVAIRDLGAWWEKTTGLPIPLGGILARRSLGAELIGAVDRALAASLAAAEADPERARDYIRRHAQELDDAVIDQHIGLYVNHFSRDLGDAGIAAIEELLRRGEERGLFPRCDLPLFAA